MKTLVAAVALCVLGSVQARAQFGGAQQQPAARREENISLKLLEMAQTVDEALLREAMLNLGRLSMAPKPTEELAQKQKEAEKEVLSQFIVQRKQAITERAEELTKMRAEAMRPVRPKALANQPNAPASPERSEDVDKARVDVQVLETQVQYSQQALSNAISSLARAELAAEDDESQRDKVETARKKFEKLKTIHVEHNKRLREATAKLYALDPQSTFGGMGGMGGGMGGMGAGMR